MTIQHVNSENQFQHQPMISKVLAIISRIGIEVHERTLYEHECFLPGILIESGQIVFDPFKAHPGNILHEAGHLAVIAAEVRQYINGDVAASLRVGKPAAFFEGLDPMDPRTYCGELASIGWSWFAAKEAGVPETLPFELESSYEGKGENIANAIAMGIGSGMGSQASCELYYAGFLESKGSGRMAKWTA